MAISNKKLSTVFSLVVLVVLIITFSYYILFNNTTEDLSGGNTGFSDYIEGTLWAYATIESGHILSDTFIYPYAIPFGANLLFAPFVRILGINLLANRLGMMLFFVIVCLTFVYFSTAIDTDGGSIFTIMSLMLMSFSTQLAFNLLLHILYYLLGFVCMTGMLASIIWLKRSSHKRTHYIILMLYSLWGAANGLPSVALSIIPVFTALMLSMEDIRKDYALQIVAASLICGLLVYKLTMNGVHESDYLSSAGAYQLQSISTWFEHIRALPETWFSLFITCDPKGVFVFQGTGVFVILEIIFSLVITAAPVPYIMRYKKLCCTEKLVFHSAIIVWIVCLSQFVFLRSLAARWENRVLFNGVLMNAMLLAVWYPHLHINWRKKTSIVSFFAIGALASFMCVFLVAHNTGPIECELAEELQNRGFSHGYATFWNANKVTVLTNGRVRCCTVQVNNKRLTPRYYNIDSTWYQYQEGDFFVALRERDLDGLKDEEETYWNKFFQDGAKEVFLVDDVTVFVFDEKNWELLVAE